MTAASMGSAVTHEALLFVCDGVHHLKRRSVPLNHHISTTLRANERGSSRGTLNGFQRYPSAPTRNAPRDG